MFRKNQHNPLLGVCHFREKSGDGSRDHGHEQYWLLVPTTKRKRYGFPRWWTLDYWECMLRFYPQRNAGGRKMSRRKRVIQLDYSKWWTENIVSPSIARSVACHFYCIHSSYHIFCDWTRRLYVGISLEWMPSPSPNLKSNQAMDVMCCCLLKTNGRTVTVVAAYRRSTIQTADPIVVLGGGGGGVLLLLLLRVVVNNNNSKEMRCDAIDTSTQVELRNESMWEISEKWIAWQSMMWYSTVQYSMFLSFFELEKGWDDGTNGSAVGASSSS